MRDPRGARQGGWVRPRLEMPLDPPRDRVPVAGGAAADGLRFRRPRFPEADARPSQVQAALRGRGGAAAHRAPSILLWQPVTQ